MSNPNADLAAVVKQMREENEKLKAQLAAKAPRTSLKVSAKGAVSLYGMGRFPVTLYAEQWAKVLGMSEEILTFVADHKAELSTKADGVVKPALSGVETGGASGAEAFS